MKLCSSHCRRHLVAVLAIHVVLLTFCAQAEFFNILKKITNKNDVQTSASPNEANQINEDDKQLASELTSMSQRHSPTARRSRPNLNNLANKNAPGAPSTLASPPGQQHPPQTPPQTPPHHQQFFARQHQQYQDGVDSDDESDVRVWAPPKSGAAPLGLPIVKSGTANSLKQPRLSAVRLPTAQNKKSKFLSGKFLKDKVKMGYKKTVSAINEIPKMVSHATDSLSSVLKLDNRGRLLALIEEVNDDLKFVRKQFSQFSFDISPIIERSLNYLGTKDLDKVRWVEKDELDFRRDALHALAFAFEFMRLMVAWREELMLAHQAYKQYLERIKAEMTDKQQDGQTKFDIDEDFIFQLNTIHNYLLLTSWMEIDQMIVEPKMKLNHLMEVEDDMKKNYESDYFRYIVTMQEMWAPTSRELDAQRSQVIEAVASAGVTSKDFEDIDVFFDEFRDVLGRDELPDVDWEVPKELDDLIERIRPELQYNNLIYKKDFLKKLKAAIEMQQQQGD